MSRNFFKDNFSRVADIKKPTDNPRSDQISALAKKRQNAIKVRISKNKLSPPKRFLLVAVIIFMIGGSAIAYELFSLHRRVVRSLESEIQQLGESALGFNLLNPESFSSGRTDSSLTDSPLGDIGGKIIPLIKNSFESYKVLRELASKTATLVKDLSSLVGDGPSLVLDQKGSEIISRLKGIESALGEIEAKNLEISRLFSEVGELSSLRNNFYLPLQFNLGQLAKLVSGLSLWLDESPSRHVLVLFQNSSELRPAGGFLGSFADLNLKKGSLAGIDIYDINESDRELVLKIIPPKPVQVIASRFKAADSNWFFDFPASAEKVAELIEASDFSEVEFDAVIAVSPRVVSDILSLAGPIEIPDEGVTIDKDNFLIEIQNQVQENRASKDPYPKRILEKATPSIIERLSKLDEKQKRELMVLSFDWFSDKDSMIYFKDKEFQKVIDTYGISGRIFETQENFFGDYLAVVNANLGGGKTDIFMDQEISLESQINGDGIISNHLTIKREHHGDEAKSWWYKVKNQNYLQIFTPTSAKFENLNGGVEKKISPPVNYLAGKYISDPEVSSLEATEKEILGYPSLKIYESFGKNIFSVWTETNPGKTSEVSLYYSSRLPSPMAEGKTYQFVFDKQAGANGSYKFQINAPVGFVWQENNLPVFEYSTIDIPGRVILNLTPKKLR